jgi:hypothetical protein
MATNDLKVTVTITAKALKEFAYRIADNEIYDCFEDNVLKAAGMPTITVFTSKIMADPKFINAIEERVYQLVAEEEDFLYDGFEYEFDFISDAYNKCCDIARKLEAEEQEANEEKNTAANLKKYIAWIKKQGYTVTKNKVEVKEPV